jgi:hypothetical protein
MKIKKNVTITQAEVEKNGGSMDTINGKDNFLIFSGECIRGSFEYILS